jgi:uncharacterized protein (DUF885 family)
MAPTSFPGARRLRPRFALVHAALGALALAACAGSPAAPASAPAPAASPAATIEVVARRYLDLSPGAARGAGLHEYDGKLEPVSAADVTRRIITLHQLESDVARIEQASTSEDERLDCRVLGQSLAQELFYLTEVESWRTSPLYYSELFGVDQYIVRDYAPKEQRARALLAHVKSALAQVDHVQENLRSPLSEPLVKTSIDVFKGFAEYLRGDVQRFLDDAADPKTKSEAKGRALELAGRAEQIAGVLERVELPKADQSHALGRERYEHLLRAQEALATPIEELEQMAEADLARNKAEYEALAKTVQKTRPQASELLDEARKVVAASRAFVVDKRIVTLPLEPHVDVKETPPFMRWNSAFLNGAGPLEPATLAAYYYITLPDPSWPPKEQAEYVMTRGEIVSTSVHEVFPGHYLQSLWQRSAPTFVQKVFGSYSFNEGWAHYVEQMMVDEGFAADTPEVRLGQLSDALLRNCRFVASIGIHVRGMSVDEARQRFKDDCKQDDANARQQAVRGTFDPGYFAYTLGKLQILELREAAKQKLGAKFELQRFHDALLAHGAPPVPLIRERVLAALGAG